MKKTLLFILLLLCIILTGCSNKVTEIKVNDIIACIDNFYITDYSFIAVYKDGTEEEVFMTESMFSEEDLNKLYDIGEYQITLNYEGVQKQFNIVLEERKAISITPLSNNLSVYIQEFKYEMVKFEVKFNDNTSEEVSLSKDLLDNDEILALGKAGTYDITVEYEGIEASFSIELLPNEIAIEELDKDVVVYCITKKVDGKYQSVFYALGNKDFSGLQFKLNIGSKVENLEVKNVNEKAFVNKDTLTVSYVNSVNTKGTVELFTLVFASSQQYRNFTMDYDLESKIVYIDNSEVKEITDFIFTFTR